jgi:hypothetical protein
MTERRGIQVESITVIQIEDKSKVTFTETQLVQEWQTSLYTKAGEKMTYVASALSIFLLPVSMGVGADN